MLSASFDFLDPCRLMQEFLDPFWRMALMPWKIRTLEERLEITLSGNDPWVVSKQAIENAGQEDLPELRESLAYVISLYSNLAGFDPDEEIRFHAKTLQGERMTNVLTGRGAVLEYLIMELSKNAYQHLLLDHPDRTATIKVSQSKSAANMPALLLEYEDDGPGFRVPETLDRPHSRLEGNEQRGVFLPFLCGLGKVPGISVEIESRGYRLYYAGGLRNLESAPMRDGLRISAAMARLQEGKGPACVGLSLGAR